MPLFPIAAALAVTMLLAVLAGGAQASYLSAARKAKLSPTIVKLAKKWASTRSLPPEWVVATIILESGGNQYAHNRSGRDDSYGLMQVNWLAHGDALSKAGIRPEDLFDPNVNIDWGTRILKDSLTRAQRAGAPSTFIATRLAYTGRPATSAPAPDKAVEWREALAQGSALV